MLLAVQEGTEMNTIGDLARLTASFERHLRAENKSPKTVETYAEAITSLTRTWPRSAPPESQLRGSRGTT
jgi:hypothetical protein